MSQRIPFFVKAFDQVSEDATPFIRISMALCFKSLINLNFLLYIIEFHIHNGVYYNTSFKYLVDIGKRTDYFLHFLEEARTIVKKGGGGSGYHGKIFASIYLHICERRGEKCKSFSGGYLPPYFKGQPYSISLLILSLEKGALPKHKSLLSHVLLVIWKNDTYT